MPVGRGRSRTYVAYQEGAEFHLQGNENISRFIEEAKRAESVATYFDDAKPIGPLASFRCGDFWVDHPYKDGVALIGDAAATTDPAFGQGLSLTVRDVRVLRDQLLSTEDWYAAVMHMRLNMTVIVRWCAKLKTGTAWCFCNKAPMRIRDAVGHCR